MPGNHILFAFIPIIDNNAVESVENFSLSIEIPPEFVHIGVQLGDVIMATGFIVDDDGKPFESCMLCCCSLNATD